MEGTCDILNENRVILHISKQWINIRIDTIFSEDILYLPLKSMKNVQKYSNIARAMIHSDPVLITCGINS